MIPNLRHSSFVSQRLLRGIRKNFPVEFKSQLFLAQALVAIALSLEEYLCHGLLALSTNKLQKRTCHLKTGKMFFSLVSSIDKDLKIFIVVDDKFVVHSRNSVAKHRAIVFAITWFHPWTYRQLGQTWHAPDVDIVINYRGWKFESVICNKEKSLTGKPNVISKERIYRAFSLTWATSMLMYRSKRKRLQKTRDQLPQNWLGILTRPQFHCFGTPIWPPWRHVKTLYINKATFPPSPKLTYILQNCF